MLPLARSPFAQPRHLIHRHTMRNQQTVQVPDVPPVVGPGEALWEGNVLQCRVIAEPEAELHVLWDALGAS